ncbi:MAG: DUF58 domain-containing protein [Arenicellales bacterium WSBS_2016_MAG_OTU3]
MANLVNNHIAKNAQEECVSISAHSLMQLRHAARQLRTASFLSSRSSIAGSRQSRFRGRGMDYVESRRYLPGDDIRTMDWRVTARSGHPHTKIFQEERERSIFIAVDLSDSMQFGTRVAFKSVIAAKVASLLGWVAINRGDRFGAAILSQSEVSTIPMKGGPRAMQALTQLLSAATQNKNTMVSLDASQHSNGSFETLLREGALKAPTGSSVFVISDFDQLDTNNFQQEDTTQTDISFRTLRKHRGVTAIRILDRLEVTTPAPGRYAITDGKLRSQLETRSKHARASIQQRLTGKGERIRSRLSKSGLSIIEVLTDDDLLTVLRRQIGGPTMVSANEQNSALASSAGF